MKKELVTLVAVVACAVLVGIDKLDADAFVALLIGTALAGPRAVGAAVRDAGEKVGISVR